MSKLKIACIQFNPIWKEVDSNLHALNLLLAKIPADIDLIILPEMFSTGFVTDPDSLIGQFDKKTLEWMLTVAKTKKVTITGSYIAAQGDKYRNRLAWVNPEGEVTFYDKKHLFTYSGEHLGFESGNEKIFPEIDDWTFQPLICYDLRFPVWSRNTNNYDIAIYVANWPKVRRHAWLSLLRARAIENQCFCIGVNRPGTDGNGLEYCGDTIAFDFKGNQIESLSSDETIMALDLDRDDLMSFRSKFPFLADRDEFIVK